MEQVLYMSESYFGLYVMLTFLIDKSDAKKGAYTIAHFPGQGESSQLSHIVLVATGSEVY